MLHQCKRCARAPCILQLRNAPHSQRTCALQCLAAVARAWADATAFAAWQSRSGEVQAAGREQQVSIVVPVLNEEGALPELLARLRELRPAPAEIIFVDGGSSDRCRAGCCRRALFQTRARHHACSHNVFGCETGIGDAVAGFKEGSAA